MGRGDLVRKAECDRPNAVGIVGPTSQAAQSKSRGLLASLPRCQCRKQTNRFAGPQGRSWLSGVSVGKNAGAALVPLDLGLKMQSVTSKDF